MEKFKPTNIKGAADVLPATQTMRNKIVQTLKRNFESYGYAPIETASLNYLELLTHKYDENAEIVREVYKLRDQGDRDLGLRYDLTVPFCKFIAMNRGLKMPFRRYEIGKVWRNGPTKAGRLREFYQCDIDVVGSKELSVEAEQIALAVSCFRQLGIEPVVRYGNRKLLGELIAASGVEPKDHDKVIGVIDKIDKITKQELLAELEKFMPGEGASALLKTFEVVPETVAALAEVREFETYLDAFGVRDVCVFAPQLARGLNYYTGTVWEFYDKQMRISSSLGGGGRYDTIITDWIDNGQAYPAVGMALGLEPIMEVLKTVDETQIFTEILVVPKPDALQQAHQFAQALRQQSTNPSVLMWHGGKVTRAMEYADKANIPFVVVVGMREIEAGKVKIKNMKDGSEVELRIDELAQICCLIKK